MKRMKNKNKKKRSLIRGFAAIAVLSVLAVLLTQQNIKAHHTDADSCEPASGVTQAILDPKYGIADAGTLDFDIIEKKAWHNSRACVKKSTKQIEGWAWNTNWGYVNFKCGDYDSNSLTPLTSIDGVSCGTIKYGSGVVELPDKSLSLVGYAWGDNIGWISLACRNFDNSSDGSFENYVDGDIRNQIITNKVNCGNIEYGISVDGETGNLSGYGYTNTVGWIKGDGAKIPALKASIVPFNPATNTDNPGGDIVFPDPTAGGSVTPPDPIYDAIRVDINNPHVYANGTDSYLINVKVKRGDQVLGCTDASVSINPLFTENVDFDQTDALRETGGDSPVSSLLDGISYPLTNSQFKCDSITGVRTAKIASVAPTNTENTLTLNSITVSGQDLFPNVITGANNSHLPRSLDFYPAIDIDTIESQGPQGSMIDKLYGVANTPNPIEVIISRKIKGGAIPNNSGVYVDGEFKILSGAISLYDFWFDGECNGEPDSTTIIEAGEPIQIIEPTSSTFSILLDKFLTSNSLEREDNTATAKNKRLGCLYSHLKSSDAGFEVDLNLEELKSKIGYLADTNRDGRFDVINDKSVKYFSKSLPSASVMNQFAMVTGGTAIGEFQELVKVKDDTTDEWLSVVSNITKGAVGIPDKDRWNLVKRFAPYTRRTDSSIVRTNVSPTETITLDELALQQKSRKVLYYRMPKRQSNPFKLVLTNPAFNWINNIDKPDGAITGPKTIICEGCDAYIDIDVIDPAKIGLIILKDPTIQNIENPQRQGGNVYLCNSVTETNLSVFADGSLYSYGEQDDSPDGKITRGDVTSCNDVNNSKNALVDSATGLPIFPGAAEIEKLSNMKQLLKNQYTNYGVLQTKNTLGGFAKTPPKTADWKQGDPPADPWKARLQDLNYLRFAEVDPRKVNVNIRKTPPEEGILWSPKTELSLSLGSSEEAYDPNPRVLDEKEEITENYPPKVGIVNFIGTDIRKIPILGFR